MDWQHNNQVERIRRPIALGLAVTLAVTTFAPVPAVAQARAKTSGANPEATVQNYCASCHSNDLRKGDLSLENFDLVHPGKDAETAEKIIRKLRAGMMPPAGRPRPAGDDLDQLAATLERRVDATAALHPYAGFAPLHRLNRREYANSVKALLDLDIDVNSLLPADDMSHGFNNMADVLGVSPALLEAYVSAASKISRLAVGDAHATSTMSTYIIPRVISQTHHTAGAPMGTRGGAAVEHIFPADGEYVFKVMFYTHQMGYLFGQPQAKGQQLEVSIDGSRVALIDVDPKYKDTDDVRTPAIKVTAGTHTVSAAFLQKFDGPVQDEVEPYDQSLIDVNVASMPGLTTLPHLRSLIVVGPEKVTGVSDTPGRRKVFVVHPASAEEEPAAARKIVTDLVRRAYRKPAAKADVDSALRFYDRSRAQGRSFDEGIRASLQAVLANPQFIFRFEHVPPQAKPGTTYRLTDLELASRLSFFLWSAPPDDELLRVAVSGRLHEHAVLERQVRRMIADRRAATLADNFAVQWLNLKNLDEVLPDPYQFPSFDRNLAQSMQRETELLFDDIVRSDRDVLTLLTADYTYVDERLAKHYGIPNVLGSRFRRVPVTDDNRHGLLGHASILTLTSTASRTAPVTRGKWVMQVLFGAPPPPPPAAVPPLAEAGETPTVQTVRQRMEEHRKNPACASCHRAIDPIGFSLENYDPTGAWRTADLGVRIDASGKLFDGAELKRPADLRAAVLRHRIAFLRTFAENLYAYGLGRIPDYRDDSAIRAIQERALTNGNRFSQYVLGVVESPGFTERTIPVPVKEKKVVPAARQLQAETPAQHRIETPLPIMGSLALQGGRQ